MDSLKENPISYVQSCSNNKNGFLIHFSQKVNVNESQGKYSVSKVM